MFHSGNTPEVCLECRFDAGEISLHDAKRLVSDFPSYVERMCSGVEQAIIDWRPEPTVWSIGEYVRHCRHVFSSMRALLDLASNDKPTPVVDEPNQQGARADDVPRTTRIDTEVDRLALIAAEFGESAFGNDKRASDEVVVNGQVANRLGIVMHAVHELMHHLSDIGRIIAMSSAATPVATGVVERIGISAGGPHKTSVDRVAISLRGLEGDSQANKKHHGSMYQAVSLFSLDVIEQLASEGHPIVAGSVGENLTISGIVWSTLRLGTRLRIGSDVVIELTDWANPCRHIAASFTDDNFRRIGFYNDPAASRVYANVVRDGTISVHDAVRVVPRT